MCSVGDMGEVDLGEGLPVKQYVCNECNNKFKGIGNKVRCPSCQSTNVKQVC